jgi:peptidyl-prolyl cis-trans isomerase A (cyclophilin A)
MLQKDLQKKNPLIMFFKCKSFIFSSTLFALLSFNVQSTVVEIRTSVGIIEVNLFDNTTPETVSNFLTYVNSGAYADNVVHRSVSNFVIQGGGFQYTGPVSLTDNNQFALDAVQTGQALVNEPKLSNVRGTIAMAKLGGQPNSATSQWFINLSNNVSSLDANVQGSEGYSVFGQVIGDGMQVVDAIAALSVLGGEPNFVFKEIPLRNYTAEDLTNKVDLTDDNLVVISDIVVTDSTVATNTNLNPALNTSLSQPKTNVDSGGGGSIFWLVLMTVCSIQFRRRFN